KIEALEEVIAQGKEMIRGLVECQRRKAESLQDLGALGQRGYSGVRLDATRLVEAALARRTGAQPKLFRRRRASFDPVFDPRQHLVVMGLDLNDLRPGPLSDPGFSHRFLGWLVTAYRLLEVDVAILGFADHLVPLPDGREVYVHAPLTLKGPDEPFDARFWNRLAHVLEHPPRLPGEPASFFPLLMRSIGRRMEDIDREWRHGHRVIVFGARRGMPRGRPEFHTPEFLSRAAEALDAEVEAIRRRFEGVVDTQAA